MNLKSPERISRVAIRLIDFWLPLVEAKPADAQSTGWLKTRNERLILRLSHRLSRLLILPGASSLQRTGERRRQ